MDNDGNPLAALPLEKGSASSEMRQSFTSKDLERALAKQKEEHDASIEALVKMRLDALDARTPPLENPGGVIKQPNASLPNLGQQSQTGDHTGVPWLYAKSRVEKPRYNAVGNPPLLDNTADFSFW